MRRGAKRSGFTMLELMVVMVILVILSAVVLPMVQASREKSRREACATRLKILTTALHLYHDNWQKFPSSGFNKDGSVVSFDNMASVKPGSSAAASVAPYSFIVKLLPYIEQSHLYDQIQFSTDDAFSTAHNNIALASTVIPALMCPSFAGRTTSTASEYRSFASPPAVGNYKSLGATTLLCMCTSASTTGVKAVDKDGGTIHPFATYSFNNLKAPTQTAILVESKEQAYAAWWDGTTAAIPGFHPGKNNDVNGAVNAAEDVSLAVDGQPALNLRSYNGQTDFMTTAFGSSSPMAWGPSSEHPGLVNHANGGTETRSIANDIDTKVYRALISRRADDNADSSDMCLCDFRREREQEPPPQKGWLPQVPGLSP